MPHKPRGRIVTKAELAELTGKTPETLTAHVNRGLPVVEAGDKTKPWRFNTAEVFAWYERGEHRAERGNKDADPLRRKTIAEAELKELELGQRRGELVKLDDVLAVVDGEYAVVREHILGAPGKLAGVIPPEHLDMLEDELHEALSELSGRAELGAHVAQGGGGGADEDAEAAPEAQSHPVGRPAPAGRAKDISDTGKVEDRRPAGRLGPHGRGH